MGRVYIALLATCCLVAPASAATVISLSSILGDFGSTVHTFSSGGLSIIVQAGELAGSTTFSTTGAPDLTAKATAVDETGLGLTSDPTGQGELTGNNVIRIASLGDTITGFEMNSVTNGETWSVFGSDSPTGGYTLVASGSDELLDHPISGFDFYVFESGPSPDNVLVASIDVAPVPLPGVAPLLAGIFGLGGYFLQRKRQAKVV